MAKRVSVDRLLFVVTLLLVFVGLIMVFSASAVIAKERYHSGYFFLTRQMGWAVAGFIAMMVGMRVDYKRLKHPAVVFSLMALTTVMLISVFFLDRSHNTHRWFHVGGVSFQPSELAKPVLILFLAFFLESRTKSMDDWRNTLIPAVLPTLLFVVLIGVGLMEGKEKLFYLPEPHTDFIFSVLGEELGLVGCLAVVLLFAAFLWRGVRTALRTPDMFGRFLAVGITSMVVVQAFINISVVLGLMPTKGIPLPLISYGGSSLFITLACVGVLLNITKQAE